MKLFSKAVMNTPSACGGDSLFRDGIFEKYLADIFLPLPPPEDAAVDKLAYTKWLPIIQKHLGCISPGQALMLDVSFTGAAEYVDLLLQEQIHELRQHNPTHNTARESYQTEGEDLQHLPLEKCRSSELERDGEPQDNRHDVHHLVLRTVS